LKSFAGCFLVACASHACNLHNRVGSTLPDGTYELVPQAEVKLEVPQQEEVAPDPEQVTDPVSAQAQGKHRSIHPILKVLAITVYVLVH
jgi:hypothetical protein